MARYPLNLPIELKQEAEQWADRQGVSFNQFVLWAVAEKVGALKQNLDDPAFPRVTFRRGATGMPTAMVRGTNIRVQSLVIAAQQWEWSNEQIAVEYGLSAEQVQDALAFYQAHRTEIDAAVAAEKSIEPQHV